MILAFESSCDETAVAIFDPRSGIVGEWIHSQIALHAEHGGVVPDIATREHLRNFGPLLAKAIASEAWGRVDPRWANYITLCKSMWEKSGLLAGEFEGTGTGQMAKAMERYNEEVKCSVPAERLLVWSPADGWAPLCEFLEVPVPDAPLPHVNDTKGFGDKIVDLALGALNDWRQQEALVA